MSPSFFDRVRDRSYHLNLNGNGMRVGAASIRTAPDRRKDGLP
jgi:hypothetical protein